MATLWSEPTRQTGVLPVGEKSPVAARRPSSWWHVLSRTLAGFNDDNIPAVAAGATFYTLLAIFPGMGALISLYGLFADPNSVWDHLSLFWGVLPGGALDVLGAEMHRVASQPQSSLGIGFFIGLTTALWSASAGVRSLSDALNTVYHEREGRHFVWRTAVSILFTLGGVFFLMLALGAVVGVPIVLTYFGFESLSAILMTVLRWPALLFIANLFLAILYRFAPSRAMARWRWISWGSALAACLWIAVSLLFSWYVANFGSYNRTYGSLGAVVGFMTWIWLSIMIFLLGAELDSEVAHRNDEQERPANRGVVPARPMQGT